MIIATAGHVDHGKTALLQAITGVNADRLPEEKRRGMTIDLGYAYWPQPDGRVLGFIDVPGHEKFLANMLSGIGGIDRALLVVACDDGMMAQTREHLAILQLIGRPALTVALTKADRVAAERVTELEQQVRQLTQQAGWQTVDCFVTSVADGRGIDALRHHLSQLPERIRTAERRFRLAIDRAFTINGAGLVVTGTALDGEVRVGDHLWLTGANRAVRVRGIHAQNQPAHDAHGGQRIALNLTGDIAKAEVTRGAWLLENRRESGSERVIVALESLQPLKQWQPLHIHHAARHITGRVSLLEGCLAELVLDEPLWLADNDRLILRDINARQTLAAARVILLSPPKRGKRQPDTLQWLHQLAQAKDDAEVLRLYLQQQPWHIDDLAWSRQLTASALAQRISALNPIQADDYLIPGETAHEWKARLAATLESFHHNHNDQPGVGGDRLRRMALPHQPAALVMSLINSMVADKSLANSGGWLHLPTFNIAFTPQEEALWQRAEALFDAEPWWVRDLAAALQEPEETVRHLLRTAAQLGYVTAVVRDRYYRSQQIQIFADLIRQRAAQGGNTRAADFRTELGTGRKIAVQILEFFDRSGFTRRQGNTHLLRDNSLFPGGKCDD
ncbi:Selenocysteinyl-tRNA-specific translation factor [Paramixta manurensis]|uniref:Selenocysteine-specific elongation factor n=1 Tax=Paramixta manurensis TaxID=2740817 RepID=A0A6M8UHS7_9GAMM|nr:Selenocysteinyl-tRNA-specific translation factor [Erwiniaceae bacterium PD-1]